MIALHTTGHTWAPDGALLRGDMISGRWVATRYNERLVITAEFVGTDEMVHEQIIRWSSGTAPCPNLTRQSRTGQRVVDVHVIPGRRVHGIPQVVPVPP